MKENLSLFVVAHKKININNYPDRKIIYVGKNNFHFDNIKEFKDDSGDNISSKNSTYCELTALYWLWKNYKDSTYIGIEHYRRCFYRNLFSISSIDRLYKKVSKIDFLHFQRVYHPFSEKFRMSIHQGKDVYKVLHDSVERVRPEYLKQFNHQMKCWYCTYCNIFICKKEIFDKYMEFIFPILFDAEKHLNEIKESKRKRAIGYMAERLLDTFINYNHFKHKSNLVMFTNRYKKY